MAVLQMRTCMHTPVKACENSMVEIAVAEVANPSLAKIYLHYKTNYKDGLIKKSLTLSRRKCVSISAKHFSNGENYSITFT